MQAGHRYTNCPKETLCSVPGCNQKYSKFLHVKDNRTPGVSAEQNPTVDVNGTQVDNSYFTSSSGVYLPTVKVVVETMMLIFALLDSGSTNTFVTETLVQTEQANIQHILQTEYSQWYTAHINLTGVKLEGKLSRWWAQYLS